MYHFLAWLEATGLSTWIREEPEVYAFPSILTAHTIGMGLVAGINALLALRILGVAPGVPILEMRRFFPFMWFGFWLNAASGVLLLIGYPTKAVTNPVFGLKLVFIAFAMVLVRVIERRLFEERADPQQMKWLAGASLFCWAAAITAGRLLAYTYWHLMSGE